MGKLLTLHFLLHKSLPPGQRFPVHSANVYPLVQGVNCNLVDTLNYATFNRIAA